MPILDKIKSKFFAGSEKHGRSQRKSKALQSINVGQNPLEIWEIVGELGDGAFGKVYKVCVIFLLNDSKFQLLICLYLCNSVSYKKEENCLTLYVHFLKCF